MIDSKIEWTHHTFNPWRGCTKVSEGCRNCYAETLSQRNPKVLGVWGPQGNRVAASEAMWREPLKWDRRARAAGERHRVFCASLADVFEDWKGPNGEGSMTCHKTGEPLSINEAGHIWPAGWPSMSDGDDWGIRSYTIDDVRRRLFRLIDATPNLDWLLLTKRPENIRRFLVPHWLEPIKGHVSQNEGDGRRLRLRPNVWLGTSVENQEQADKRIPHLLKCRDLSDVRFLSCEPLLGPLDLSRWFGPQNEWQRLNVVECGHHPTNRYGINWVIVGGESGPNARPMHPDWVRSIRDQCQRACVPFFFKQRGEWNESVIRTPKDFADMKHKQWTWLDLNGESGFTFGTNTRACMEKVGKANAGRELDGRTWDEMPIGYASPIQVSEEVSG